MSNLLETLVAELERPRSLSAQVIRHITGTYEVARDAMAAFFTDVLPGLEDYEHDLILSPLFTPKLADQAVFAELLGRDSVPREQWPELIRQLAARPTCAQLVTPDRETHSVVLREVTLERYVHRLRLDATIPEPIFSGLEQPSFAADRPTLLAVARRAVWDRDGARGILVTYLTGAPVCDAYRLDDAVRLLGVAEDDKPADLADLLARIPPWQERLRHDIETAGTPKPFFSENVQAAHGGSRDQRQRDNDRVSAKESELAFLDRLLRVLGESPPQSDRPV